MNTWLETSSAPEPHLRTVLFAKVVLALMLDGPGRRAGPAGLAPAGSTLAASAAAGLTERKRPFSLLRLAGRRQFRRR